MAEQITFIRKADVVKRIGVSRPTMYRRIKAGLFPRPSRLSAQLVGWNESEVDQYNVLIRANASDEQLRDFVASLGPPPKIRRIRP